MNREKFPKKITKEWLLKKVAKDRLYVSSTLDQHYDNWDRKYNQWNDPNLVKNQQKLLVILVEKIGYDNAHVIMDFLAHYDPFGHDLPDIKRYKYGLEWMEKNLAPKKKKSVNKSPKKSSRVRKSVKKSSSPKKSSRVRKSVKKSPCKKGWVVNPLTGRCIMKFKQGYERSVVTGRWIKKCINGKNRNTSSNRCNLIRKSPKKSSKSRRKSPKSRKRSRK